MFQRFLNDEEGATAIEYGLVASLIAMVIIVSLEAVANASNANYDKINAAVEQAVNGGGGGGGGGTP